MHPQSVARSVTGRDGSEQPRTKYCPSYSFIVCNGTGAARRNPFIRGFAFRSSPARRRPHHTATLGQTSVALSLSSTIIASGIIRGSAIDSSRARQRVTQRAACGGARGSAVSSISTYRRGLTPRDDHRDVVVLLVRAELPDLVDDRVEQRAGRQVAAPA